MPRRSSTSEHGRGPASGIDDREVLDVGLGVERQRTVGDDVVRPGLARQVERLGAPAGLSRPGFDRVERGRRLTGDERQVAGPAAGWMWTSIGCVDPSADRCVPQRRSLAQSPRT
jgi:hypothetical protein